MRPNRVQTAVEAFYDLIRSMTRDNMDERLAKKWFPLVGTLFVFILVTNLLGYIPLPVNSSEKIFNGNFPSFQLYAADTNVAVPLILALGVWGVFNYEGVRATASSATSRVWCPPVSARACSSCSTRWRSCPTSCGCSR